MDSTSEQILITDNKGKVLYVNGVLRQFSGLKVKDVLGKKVQNIWGESIKNSF